jgi:hypothetical protein
MTFDLVTFYSSKAQTDEFPRTGVLMTRHGTSSGPLLWTCCQTANDGDEPLRGRLHVSEDEALEEQWS